MDFKNTSETNYTMIENVKEEEGACTDNGSMAVENEKEEAGACTDNGSIAVGSGARAGGMGRRAKEEEGHEFLGMLVEKEFEGFGTFRGLVHFNDILISSMYALMYSSIVITLTIMVSFSV
jgi:hypothetical protein